jgi:glycosyltransferase involved in cell wall biosynthesis
MAISSKTRKCDKPVSIVMIAYNEADHISDVIKEYSHEILRWLPNGSEYIIYLDSPTDNTPRIVETLSRKLPIRVIVGKRNLGYAGAMANALKAARNDIIFYSDSSAKHKANDFWKLIRYEPEYDIISGLRFPRSDPFIRQQISFFQQFIISALFFAPFHDYNTGYKVIHKKLVQDVLPYCKYMGQSFSSELLIRAFKKGYTIKSVPVVFLGRKDKKSGTKLAQLPNIIRKSLKGFILLRLELLKRQEKTPVRNIK